MAEEPKHLLERVLIAGSGGQGILLTGRLLAGVAVGCVPHLTLLPSYGAEVRGGTCNCQVVFSDDAIASPSNEEFDVMLLLNQASVDRFLGQLADGGLALLNSSLCRVPENMPNVCAVSATETANSLGNARVANVVMVGAYVARCSFLSPAVVEAGVTQVLAGKPQALVELNLRAFREGLSTV